MAVHDRGVLERLAERLARRRRAHFRGTQVGDRLVATDRDLGTEQCEQVARVIGVRRQVVGVGDRPVEQCRHRAVGEVVLARRVAVPRADRRQLGEAGVALVVQRAVAAHDRGRRQLVEHHEHDRPSRSGHVDVADVDRGGAGDELRRRAEEQERGEEEDVGDGQVGHEEADALRAHDEHDDAGADEQRQHEHDDELVDTERPQEGQAERGRQEADDGEEDDLPEPAVDGRRQRRDADAEGRRDDGDRHREEDDLRRAVVAGDEELGVVPEQVEQRLGHGQCAETEDHERSRAA